jgi:hypothetical protein
MHCSTWLPSVPRARLPLADALQPTPTSLAWCQMDVKNSQVTSHDGPVLSIIRLPGSHQGLLHIAVKPTNPPMQRALVPPVADVSLPSSLQQLAQDA